MNFYLSIFPSRESLSPAPIPPSGLVASLCMLTGKVVADLATHDAPPTVNSTDFYSTSTSTYPDSPEDLFTTYHFSEYADFNTTAEPTYSPIQVASALAISAGLWQVSRANLHQHDLIRPCSRVRVGVMGVHDAWSHHLRLSRR